VNAQRTVQLSKMRDLYELRERQAHEKVLEQQANVSALELKVEEIETCIAEFINRLSELDERRINSLLLTVAMLQEEAASRSIIERDLRKERFYLDTARKDVNDALELLTNARKTWQACSNCLEALLQLEQNQYALDTRVAKQNAEREFDDLAIAEYCGSRRHG